VARRTAVADGHPSRLLVDLRNGERLHVWTSPRSGGTRPSAGHPASPSRLTSPNVPIASSCPGRRPGSRRDNERKDDYRKEDAAGAGPRVQRDRQRHGALAAKRAARHLARSAPCPSGSKNGCSSSSRSTCSSKACSAWGQVPKRSALPWHVADGGAAIRVGRARAARRVDKLVACSVSASGCG